MRHRWIPLITLGLTAGLFVLRQPVQAAEVAMVSDRPSAIAPPLPGLEKATEYLPPVVYPMRLELNLGKRRVTLYQNDQVIKSYPVAVGRAGWGTPTGTFAVKTKYRNPPWQNPFKGYVVPGGDPENPLGRRWMGFWTDGKNWIGFHGTPNRESVGTAASHGCVRMYNEDIEELFELVAIDTPVKVIR
ncbi:MAG: L,D-transpeptidase [Acaryochloridaceae cyanobacterium CSU_3_4]|nr:L,D-transpeptidase [Acaryochloridaceae cyanobacterium CSU_3_4]